MQAKLVILDGPGKGDSYPLDGDVFIIGRQDDSDFQILEAAVSRRHCEIRRLGDTYELHDAGSTRGTFVNGVPVSRCSLGHGDFLQISTTALVFLYETPSRATRVDPNLLTAGSTAERRPEEIAELLRGRQHPGVSRGELSHLLAIAAAVQELHDAQALAERLLALLLEALPAERGVVLAVTALDPAPEDPAPEDIAARPVATRGDGEVSPSRAVLARVTGERVAVLWDDVTRGAGLPASDSLSGEEVRSLLAVPLVGRHDLHGVLYLESQASGVFTETHLELTAAAAVLAGLALDTARAFGDLRREAGHLNGSEHGLVGESPAMERLLDFIGRVAPVDSTVLLRGESGTGKELVARALHRGSRRSDQPFVAVNCATLSETLFESELFGHERGAFTGAVARQVGRFETADGGTLFLDEIGEVPTALQARLLRVLQERRFERLGGSRPIAVDVRVVAATNQDLEAAIQSGTFREDLFYRLNVISYQLPPLRERRGDVALLARHFARRHGERLGRLGVGIDPAALRALAAYDWPGNVRQLSNAIERALVLGDGERVRPEDLPDEMLEQAGSEVVLSDYQTTITETKKRLLTTALAEADGNAAEAGRRLGLHPNSFRRLMRQLGVQGGGN